MIKNAIKKAFVVGVCALMTVSTVSAAKKKADPYKSVEKEKNPATKKVYDFKGLTIQIADWYSDPDATPNTQAGIDTKAWQEWSNKTYNMNVFRKACSGWGTHAQFMTNYCITGGDSDAVKYVFNIDGRAALTGIRTGLFYDLSKIKNVNYFDASHYDQGVTTRLMKGKSFYSFNPGHTEPKNGMFFNKRLLQEAGYNPDLPYDLQKAGKWNWAKFEEMCKKLTKDTDNDGVIDQYAMASMNTEFTYAALDANGGSLIGRDANGKYFNNAGSEKSIEALNWVQHMFANYQIPQPEGGSWDYFYSAFVNGECAFCADQAYNGYKNGRFDEMADDYGFVCFPLGPSSDGVYKCLQDSQMWIIPSCYKEETIQNIAKAVDLWTLPTPGYGDDAWKEDLYTGYRDSRAVDETITMMVAVPNSRYDTLIPGLAQGDIVFPITGNYGTAQESYELCKNVWQSLLDDVNR